MEQATLNGVQAEVAGQQVVFLSEKGLWWPSESTLFVADIHLGKSASFRSLTVPVPAGATNGTLARLTDLIHKVEAKQVVILGDLWHAASGRTQKNLECFIEWRNSHHETSMILVEGNHDRKSGALPLDSGVREVLPGEILGPFNLQHEPTDPESDYGLAGHIHPSVRLVGNGDRTLSLPCFWVRENYAVLPSFGEFTGSYRVSPTTTDRVFAITDRSILEL